MYVDLHKDEGTELHTGVTVASITTALDEGTEGETIVRDAAEMRVKETDRLAVMTAELRKLGAAIEERPDGFRVAGPQALHGALVDGHDDHRVAMALAVAGLVADGETVIEDAACVGDSFPGFVETMRALGAEMGWCDHD